MINFDTLIDNTLVSQKDSATESNAAASESTTQTDSGTTSTDTATTGTDTSTATESSQAVAGGDSDDSDTTSTGSTEDTSSSGDTSSTVDKDSDASSVPVVPAKIAGTAQANSLKPRYQGDAEFAQMVAQDWDAVILADPRSYEAILYRPSNGTYGVVDDETGLEAAPFTDLDNNQRELTYEDPVIVTLRDSNDSREAFENLDDDSAQNGLVDDFLIVSIAARNIPKGSILEWNEEMIDGTEKRVWWYVNQIYSYGTQHVGTLYYCIPARTFDTTAGGTPS